MTHPTKDTIFVVGAGFSAGLGYPLTKTLLVEGWYRLPKTAREQLQKIITFHHPSFNPDRKTSFPDIEQLLTAIEVNDQMFDASRPAPGRFTRTDLQTARETLLLTIASWFHELYSGAVNHKWLNDMLAMMRDEACAIISFNWDLVLDQMLFEGDLNPDAYGLSDGAIHGPILLKPHGSLNWYQGSQLNQVSEKKRVEVFHHAEKSKCVNAFLRPREVQSTSGHRYIPLIIPPTYMKDFTPPVFQRLWNKCTELLSTPKEIVFLGYSLPAADLQAQFIFRCGFHNQINGRLKRDGSRYKPTGAAKVIIVNPDQDTARRIESVAGPNVKCTWFPQRIDEWVEERDLS
jgi:hypothetical protein